MTRKDYELIAGTIRNLSEMVGAHNLTSITLEFANTLASTNPLFNRERFFKACGIN